MSTSRRVAVPLAEVQEALGQETGQSRLYYPVHPPEHVDSEQATDHYGNDFDEKVLYIANVVAGMVHAISFFAALAVSLIFQDRIYRGTITATITRLLVVELVTLGRYSISWTILPFPIITSLFHFASSLVSPLREHVNDIALRRGEPSSQTGWNWVRWVEYAITASFMTWTIAQLSGVTDLATLVCFVGLNVMMQLTGGLGHEWSNKGWSRESGKRASWWLFCVGFVPFAIIWAVIITYFVVQVSASSAPAFVWVAVFSMLAFFASFVVPILLHYSRWSPVLHSNLSYELSYIVLSKSSKITLDWTLVLGGVFRS